VYRGGRRRSSPHFVVFFRANGLERSRFGASVKKALGGAVVRNRIRRRIREIVRRNYREIPSGWDIVIHPRASVAGAEFAAIEAELTRLLQMLAN
jgi:ribonuclease P protein component